jgi:hypothetical protein
MQSVFSSVSRLTAVPISLTGTILWNTFCGLFWHDFWKCHASLVHIMLIAKNGYFDGIVTDLIASSG